MSKLALRAQTVEIAALPLRLRFISKKHFLRFARGQVQERSKGFWFGQQPLKVRPRFFGFVKTIGYYGHYSNVSRGRQKKQNRDALIPSILQTDDDPKACRKNWARLIQKIYEADPPTCPRCQGQMRIISSIEDPEFIKKILKRLGLWLPKGRP